MALQQEYTCNQYVYPDAYIKAHIGNATVEETVVIVYIWPTQQDRLGERPPIYTTSRVFPTDFNMAASNPIEYVYGLLKSSEEFQDAIDILE